LLFYQDSLHNSFMLSETTTIEKIYTVSRLNQSVRLLLEERFATILVEGEISNFAAPHSGHWYFSLKDSTAQVRCALFKGSQRQLNFTPKDGVHVLIKARVSLYENRGEFQLIVENMEEQGEGRLYRAFQLLKNKLEKEGLFDAAHKKPIPCFPKQIGVVTSPTGAAIRDILTVLKRRYALVPIIIYPALVQCHAAAASLVEAIHQANQRAECDVILLARGGGSLEDLWPFNEEIVARAIYQSQIPIVTGVGHEVDFTIADFVADLRAPTPSAAAELSTPDQAELHQVLQKQKDRLSGCIKRLFAARTQQLIWVKKHLLQQHPKRRLQTIMQRLDQMTTSLIHHLQSIIHKKQSLLNNKLAKLDALSPLATLKRGFAIAVDEKGNIIRTAASVKKGSPIKVKLSQDGLACTVDDYIK
jgi:exodeoxyribonuclease VII large subunit